MKIVLLGATGAVGRHVLEQALEAGHTVAAVVRDASKLPARSRLEVHQGSLGDRVVLEAAMAGASAVASALGVTPASKHDLPSRHLPAVLEAMKRIGVRRYIGISGAGIDAPGDNKNLPARLLSALVRRISPEVFEDKQRELEVLLSTPDIDWTLARAPRLIDGPRTGGVRVSLERSPGVKIRRADIAAFLLSQLADDRYVRRAPFVAA